jgi:hypothetical protein
VPILKNLATYLPLIHTKNDPKSPLIEKSQSPQNRINTGLNEITKNHDKSADSFKSCHSEKDKPA